MDIVRTHPLKSSLPSDRVDSFLLVRHPQVMDKLRKDIASVCGTSTDWTRTDLWKMMYLQNVLKESIASPSLLLDSSLT